LEGKTLGTPIAIVIRNTNQRSSDYERADPGSLSLKELYRPGHADWTWEAKYGFRDHRGGGRSSGRETAGRVAAGAVAKALLAQFGISIRGWSASIAGIEVPPDGFDLREAEKNPLRVPHREGAKRIREKLERLRDEGDSAGGIAACRAEGLPPGMGEPVFDKLQARLGEAILSIGGVKGIEFGAGFRAAGSRGSLNNDRPLLRERPFTLPRGVPSLAWETNNAGGVLGGLSTGEPVEFRAAFKPVSSIAKPQKTIGRDGKVWDLAIEGRHDVCIVPRAVPVVEAMTALVLADLLLLSRLSRLESLI
jgi:chorismate synthase